MSAQTRIPPLLCTLAALVLAGCGGGESTASPPPSTPPATSASASTSAGSGELTDDQITCLDAGEAIVEAQIPPGTTPPAAGPEALQLDRRILDALDSLDGLHAMGALAAGIDRVMSTMGETTALQMAQSGRDWSEARADLTDAVTELKSTCAAAGVPDYLNP